VTWICDIVVLLRLPRGRVVLVWKEHHQRRFTTA
jgi:hypothetical protein